MRFSWSGNAYQRLYFKGLSIPIGKMGGAACSFDRKFHLHLTQVPYGFAGEDAPNLVRETIRIDRLTNETVKTRLACLTHLLLAGLRSDRHDAVTFREEDVRIFCKAP